MLVKVFEELIWVGEFVCKMVYFYSWRFIFDYVGFFIKLFGFFYTMVFGFF